VGERKKKKKPRGTKKKKKKEKRKKKKTLRIQKITSVRGSRGLPKETEARREKMKSVQFSSRQGR